MLVLITTAVSPLVATEMQLGFLNILLPRSWTANHDCCFYPSKQNYYYGAIATIVWALFEEAMML